MKKFWKVSLLALGLVFLLALIIILIGNLAYHTGFAVVSESQEKLDEEFECVSEIKEMNVRGRSLSGLLDSGERVSVFLDYYDCNEVNRDDIVLYSYSGNEAPLIKVVKGIPGDSFSLKETGGGWNILINGEVVVNSNNRPYVLDRNGHRMLSMYERDYNNEIPERAYLLMGNLAGGSLDSSSFGLIHKNSILGKAEAKQQT